MKITFDKLKFRDYEGWVDVAKSSCRLKNETEISAQICVQLANPRLWHDFGMPIAEMSFTNRFDRIMILLQQNTDGLCWMDDEYKAILFGSDRYCEIVFGTREYKSGWIKAGWEQYKKKRLLKQTEDQKIIQEYEIQRNLNPELVMDDWFEFIIQSMDEMFSNNSSSLIVFEPDQNKLII